MNINLCEHIYVYLCLYAYMYVCMYVCTHVCIHCNLCRCILDVYCIRTYDAFLICVQRTNNQTNTHTHRYTQTHTHTRTHTHAHTHRHTHTQRHTHTDVHGLRHGSSCHRLPGRSSAGISRSPTRGTLSLWNFGFIGFRV